MKLWKKLSIQTLGLALGCIFFAGVRVQAKTIVDTGHKRYSYSEMKNDLKLLQKRYKDRLEVNVIGKSADDRNLYEVVLGNTKAKKHLLVIANLHAREYMTIQLTMRQIEHYLAYYNRTIGSSKVSNTLKKVAIHIVPSANPDGTAISQYGFGAIKSRSLRSKLRRMGGSSYRWKANARGVDLNRNWNVAFKVRGGSPGGSGFSGYHKASEPETQALVKWVNSVDKKGKVVGVISYHSTGSIIYGRTTGVSSSVRRNTAKMNSLIRRLTGYYVMPANGKYAARGNSREYFLYTKKMPCVTIEVGHGACPLSSGEFSSIYRKNKDLVMKTAMLFD